MAGVYGDDVARAESVGQPGRTGAGPPRQRGDPPALLLQPGAPRVPPVLITQIVGQDLGDELKREPEGVADQRGGTRQGQQLAPEAIERGAQQEAERLAGLEEA